MARFTPSPLFTSGCVLCHGKEIRIFGAAQEGITVRGRLTDAAGELLAAASALSDSGCFELTLPPQRPGTGCRLELTDGEDLFSAEDVAIGEVYLAGGQSNMELALSGAEEGPAQAAEARDPWLRFFNVPRMAYDSDAHRKSLADTRWHAVSPDFSGGCSAVAFFFGRKMREKHPEMPLGIIACYWGGTSVTCWMDIPTLESMEEGRRYLLEYREKSGEKTLDAFLEENAIFERELDKWNGAVEAYRREHPGIPWKEIEDACGKCPWFPPAGPGSPYRPGGLAEHMLRPLAPVTLTAFLYYQGEEDAARTQHYDELMTAMIALWRGWFREKNLPFLFVQLPMWLDFDAEDRKDWARTRLHQARGRDTVPGTGMICLLDQGEYGNIHPTCKRPVGERLAELACLMLYGAGDASPRAEEVRQEGTEILIRFTEPVTLREGQPSLLEIAGTGADFVPAEGRTEGNTLRVRAAEVTAPSEVRYAWTDYAEKVPLYGVNGLPAEPFSIRL